MGDEFGGFDDFEDDNFGDGGAEGDGVDAVDEDFGTAFGGGDNDADLDGFGDEDFEDFAGDDDFGGDDDDFGDEGDAADGKDGAAAAAPKPAATKPAAAKPAGGAQGGGAPRPAGAQPPPGQSFRSRPVAVRMNKHMLRLNQPFVAGYDMTADQQAKLGGRGLRRIVINAAMSAPGSFAAEIRTGPNGTGDVLARDSGIRSSSNFTKTVLEFSDQPVLKEGELYHLHIILEQGAFKFQGAVVKSLRSVGKEQKKIHPFSGKKGDAWAAANSVLVLKPVYQKVVPKIGDKSGYLLLKKVPRGGKKKSSLRRAGKEGVRKFVVVEGTSVKIFSKPEGSVEKEVELKTVEYVESKGGSMETKDFNMVTKSEEYQFAAPSASECQKWLKVIQLAQKNVTRDFGMAATTNMMF